MARTNMGLFGRSKTATTQTTATVTKTGWISECGPKCGFIGRSPDQKDAAGLLMLHSKNMHKAPMADKDAMAAVTKTTWQAPA